MKPKPFSSMNRSTVPVSRAIAPPLSSGIGMSAPSARRFPAQGSCSGAEKGPLAVLAVGAAEVLEVRAELRGGPGRLVQRREQEAQEARERGVAHLRKAGLG